MSFSWINVLIVTAPFYWLFCFQIFDYVMWSFIFVFQMKKTTIGEHSSQQLMFYIERYLKFNKNVIDECQTTKSAWLSVSYYTLCCGNSTAISPCWPLKWKYMHIHLSTQRTHCENQSLSAHAGRSTKAKPEFLHRHRSQMKNFIVSLTCIYCIYNLLLYEVQKCSNTLKFKKFRTMLVRLLSIIYNFVILNCV